jgi:hypothetical protein
MNYLTTWCNVYDEKFKTASVSENTPTFMASEGPLPCSGMSTMPEPVECDPQLHTFFLKNNFNIFLFMAVSLTSRFSDINFVYICQLSHTLHTYHTILNLTLQAGIKWTAFSIGRWYLNWLHEVVVGMCRPYRCTSRRQCV